MTHHRDERREHKRIDKNYIVSFQIRPNEKQEQVFIGWDMVTAVNLGAGGILLNYDRKIEPGSILDLKINFPGSHEPIECVGEVNRVEKAKKSSRVRIAAKFVEIGAKDKEHIVQAAEDKHSPEFEDIT